MPVELISWLVAAASAAAGGSVALVGGRHDRLARLVAAAVGVAGAATGLVLRAAGATIWNWPGQIPADALALLAGGALIGLIGLFSGRRGPASRDGGMALAFIGAAVLLVAAAFMAWRAPEVASSWVTRSWQLGVRNLLAAIGLGGCLVSAAASLSWVVCVARGRTSHTRPADDPGRSAALASFPWLTAAVLAGATWQLVARGAPWQATSAWLWEGAAWLLGAGYLHVTSNRRPVRAPAWLATLLAGAALAAAVAAALWAASWL